MSKATEQTLADLHGEMAEAMRKKLESGEYTASDLSVIRQFLKDNGIDAAPVGKNPLGTLVGALPDLDEDGPDIGTTH